jgi:hypothetical protein
MMAQPNIWYQNFYRIRKKVLALGDRYWIEDDQGRSLGFAKRKMLRLMEDMRVFTDENLTCELFRIQQEQIFDAWGTFAVIDSASNACVGKIRRRLSSSIVADEYLLLDLQDRQIGRIVEGSGMGLVRKYIPLGGLVPEQVSIEYYGQKVGEIKQRFRVIGDTWEVDCCKIPPNLDRRVLLASILLMGMIERDRN